MSGISGAYLDLVCGTKAVAIMIHTVFYVTSNALYMLR